MSSASVLSVLEGSVLRAMAQGDFSGPETLSQSKQLMRFLLSIHLQDQHVTHQPVNGLIEVCLQENPSRHLKSPQALGELFQIPCEFNSSYGIRLGALINGSSRGTCKTLLVKANNTYCETKEIKSITC